MCVSCGCGSMNDNHGDQRNITMDDIQQAAQAAGTSPEQVANNISSACQQMGGQAQMNSQQPAYPT